jgi:exopolysaccharide biosynthesis polyprenyl glycosylphosphotransferase
MNSQRIRVLTSFSLFLLDTLLIITAFALAYWIRFDLSFPTPPLNDNPFARYFPLLIVQWLSVTTTLFFFRQYVVRRAISRVDQLYAMFGAVTLGTLLAVGGAEFIFKNTRYEVEMARAMILFAWLLTISLIMVGRILHQMLIDYWQSKGWGRDRLLIVGTGEVAQIILQRIQWSPQLGYELVGMVNGKMENGDQHFHGVPIIGEPKDLPTLIEQHAIDEVMIAIPEKGHREVLKIISYCQRGRVSIKIFPDIFQFVTSEANIDDLGGLPLLSVRDYAMRGYWLLGKRLLDIVGAMFGLVFLSPLLLLIAVAIKLESPGPVFFVQERMGLDGKPFRILKFRSMRQDAEHSGPGWTVDNDPRQTKLGAILRLIEMDEMPQLINVLLGEMSLVGPRPEQPFYVEQFRKTVPEYMDRHKDKAGMTGWAQVNGMRGDTSIVERTKYDLWYSENWSLLLDIKILLRTLWHVARALGGVVGRRFMPAS